MTQADKTLSLYKTRIAQCLIFLRYGVGLVFLMWTLDKFINPEHAASIFEKYYKISGLAVTAAYLIGAAQLTLVIAFLAGAFKKYSYGLILILHSFSTISSYGKFLDPWSGPNLLFFAAVPMLAACWALWKLRDLDTFFSFDMRNTGS
jgi:putative oxidoreductase